MLVNILRYRFRAITNRLPLQFVFTIKPDLVVVVENNRFLGYYMK